MILNREDLDGLQLNQFILLDCRNIMDQPKETQTFINNSPLPNATHIPETPFMFTEKGITHSRHPLPYKEQIDELYRVLTRNGKKLLLVSDENSFYHTRLYYLFNLYGYTVFLYNDDLAYIKRNAQSFSAFDGELPKKPIGESIHFKKDIYRSMAYVKRSIETHSNVLLVDVRSRDRYLGLTEPIDFKKGHIPTAVNIPGSSIYTNGILNLNACDDILEDLKKYDEVIVYCGSGMSATALFTVLYHKEVNAKVFAGSFSEWITDPNNIIETTENTL